MRLLNRKNLVGANQHRSGWPYVMHHIGQIESGRGILLDDFMERTVMYNPNRPMRVRAPWIAIAHHPSCEFDEPFVNLYRRSQHHFQLHRFAGRSESLHQLQGMLMLSEHGARYARTFYGVPVKVLPHPTQLDVPEFDLLAFKRNPSIVHVGWFLKNLMLPWQIDSQKKFKKVYVVPNNLGRNFTNCLMNLRGMWKELRPTWEDVERVGRLDNEDYDAMLSSSVVCCEFFDCSAANTVIESIARNSPLLVNRHPAVVEYLGEDYPLFFDDVAECTDLVTFEKVEEAYLYLRGMDKEFLDIGYFMSRLKAWINEYE